MLKKQHRRGRERSSRPRRPHEGTGKVRETDSGKSRLLKCKTELVADKMKIMLKQVSGANNHGLIFHNSFLIFPQIVPPKIPAPGWGNEQPERNKEKME